jgi:Las1-like
MFDFALSPVNRRQDAINMVALWQFKDPQLNHALVSTAHLTDAILHDQPGRREKLSTLALRSIYAMSFCRFVNALVDRDVRKSVNATIVKDNSAAISDAGAGPHRGQSSMYAHALKLGLPECFVELRHEAIHEGMPSLEMLRLRTGEALEWLWDRWWKFNVTGSSQPALRLWEEKHGKLHANISQISVEHENIRNQSSLCQNCRKRKRSAVDEYDKDELDSGEEAETNPQNLESQKQQRRGTDAENQVPLTEERQGWVLKFPQRPTPSRKGQAAHEKGDSQPATSTKTHPVSSSASAPLLKT